MTIYLYLFSKVWKGRLLLFLKLYIQLEILCRDFDLETRSIKFTWFTKTSYFHILKNWFFFILVLITFFDSVIKVTVLLQLKVGIFGCGGQENKNATSV